MGIVDFYSGYGSYHHNVVNKWIHIIGVPLILYTFNAMGEWAKIDIGGNSGNLRNKYLRKSRKIFLSNFKLLN